MSTYWINVPSGQTVHLRSEAETNTSNVITELPRGYPVTRVFSLDPSSMFLSGIALIPLRGMFTKTI